MEGLVAPHCRRRGIYMREGGGGLLLDAELAHLESRLVDTSRLRSGSQDIHFGREIVGRNDAFNLFEKAREGGLALCSGCYAGHQRIRLDKVQGKSAATY